MEQAQEETNFLMEQTENLEEDLNIQKNLSQDDKKNNNITNLGSRTGFKES